LFKRPAGLDYFAGAFSIGGIGVVAGAPVFGAGVELVSPQPTIVTVITATTTNATIAVLIVRSFQEETRR
jgi:hypothetical protein